MLNLSTWKIRSQIMVPIVVLAVAFVVLAYQAWHSNQRMAENTDRLTGKIAPSISLVLNADRDLYQALVALNAYSLAPAAGQLEDFNDNRDQARDRYLKALEGAQSAQVNTSGLDSKAFSAAFTSWHNKAQQAVPSCMEKYSISPGEQCSRL
ncbi:hypothetical protein FJM67_15155 [Maribrevibacterium harenarium]|uniref:Methyl-accepting chemotaxis protein n=1 Tax=Maribrevibacterium harenarium TaxID=2589817 RepID=A0A501WFE6_9GAMM|nr:hypothetical protein [Maribrevibacterium harenarium]TPE47080.1 hypothetical protein FJM67_15155 [Maribrevibacterium harenarium]